MLLALGKVALYNECMKTCPKCKVEKEHSEFGKNARKKDGLDYQCKVCRRQYALKYVHLPETKKAKTENRRNRIKESKAIVARILKQSQCQDCGLDDWVVLEFDHREASEKSCNVSQLMGWGCPQETLLAEIAKCDIVCSNCHRKRTYKRGSHWRHQTS